MKIIKEERNTEYFAKKSCLDLAMDHLKENKKCYFVKLTALWGGELDEVKGESEVVARREIISQFHGVDFVKSQHRDLSALEPKTKSDYMELWDALERHQPKDVMVASAKSIVERVKANVGLGKSKKNKVFKKGDK